MIPQEIVDRITQAVTPIVDEASLELVEVEFRPTGRRWLLRLFIDKEGGVTIDDCTYVSRELSRLLDVEDIIEHAYMLEVSSPGLTRPLKKREDFKRYEGKLAKIITHTPIDGMVDLTGIIGGLKDDLVLLKIDGGVHEIPFEAVKTARLEFEL
jgi:ribosome maturation factor RimP